MPRALHRPCVRRYQDAGNRPRTTAFDTAVFPTPRQLAIVSLPRASAMSLAVVMTRHHPHLVEDCKTTIRGSQAHDSWMYTSPMTGDPFPYRQIGARLKAVRAAFGPDDSQKSWAERHAFSPTRWNNWETGARRIPVDDAERLCAAYGLTLDFIYLGRRDGLSDSASKRL